MVKMWLLELEHDRMEKLVGFLLCVSNKVFFVKLGFLWKYESVMMITWNY